MGAFVDRGARSGGWAFRSRMEAAFVGDGGVVSGTRGNGHDPTGRGGEMGGKTAWVAKRDREDGKRARHGESGAGEDVRVSVSGR